MFSMKKSVLAAAFAVVLLALAVAVGACGGNGKTITSEDYGSAWPFTVSEVELRCDGDADLATAWVEHDGKRYPLTGYTETYFESRYRNVRALEGIWKDNPSTGAKVDVGPIIRDGLAMCGS